MIKASLSLLSPLPGFNPLNNDFHKSSIYNLIELIFLHNCASLLCRQLSAGGVDHPRTAIEWLARCSDTYRRFSLQAIFRIATSSVSVFAQNSNSTVKTERIIRSYFSSLTYCCLCAILEMNSSKGHVRKNKKCSSNGITALKTILQIRTAVIYELLQSFKMLFH